MSSEEFPKRRPAIQTQRGRKRHKLGGTLQRIWASPRIGPPRSDTRPAAARQSKGEYQSVPDTVVDPRPPVSQKPLTASAVALLELYLTTWRTPASCGGSARTAANRGCVIRRICS
jgi:hypothetical protein